MAKWKVTPLFKKSIIEYNHLEKGDNLFIVETGWRSGEFIVYTDDDNPPDLKSGVDILNCGYESEMVETIDGCWTEYHYDDCDDETREWLENFLEEDGNSFFDLGEHDWVFTDGEFIIDCDMEITKIDDDGSEGETFKTDSDTNVTDTENKLTPKATWPFDSKQ